MAAIMTAHMTNTASQFAADQSDIGIVSCAAGLSMLVAPQNRSEPTPERRSPDACRRPAARNDQSRDDAVKLGSALIGERSKEAVSARDVARNPVIVDLEAG